MRLYRGWRVLDALTFGPSRRRLRLAAQLRQPDSPLYAAPAKPRAWDPAARRRGAGRGRGGRPSGPQALGLVIVAVLLAVAVPHLFQKHAQASGAGGSGGTNGSPRRVLPAVAGPRGSGGYVFVKTHPDGSPVAYDPCQPLRYVINLEGAPKGSQRLVEKAMGRLQAATGLELVDDGTTNEEPSERRAPRQVGRYGDRWAPVLIAWAAEEDYPSLAGAVTGRGGSTAVEQNKDDARYVTGQVVLDRGAFAEMMRTRAGSRTALATVLHELGHVAGLAHVPDPSELMYKETVRGASDYADGDLRGLAILGRGPCFPGA